MLEGEFERHSLREPSSPGLKLVFSPDPPWGIGAPITTAGLFARDVFHGLGLYADLLGKGLYKWKRGASGTSTYPTVILARDYRVSDMTQRYAKIVVSSPANRPANVEGREQRVAIHCNKMSATPPSHDPTVRTSAHQEIEADVHESVGEDRGLRDSRSEALCGRVRGSSRK